MSLSLVSKGDTTFKVFHSLRASSPRVSGGTGVGRGSLRASSPEVPGAGGKFAGYPSPPLYPREPQESLLAGFERPGLSCHILGELARRLGLFMWNISGNDGSSVFKVGLFPKGNSFFTRLNSSLMTVLNIAYHLPIYPNPTSLLHSYSLGRSVA